MRGSGPRSTQTRVSSADRTSHHTRCGWKDTEPQSGQGAACVPGAALWVEERGPTRSGIKKERKRMHRAPRAVTGEAALPRGDTGSTPQGRADGGGAGASLHAGTRGHLLPGPRSVSAPHTISRSLGTGVISKHRVVSEEAGGGGRDSGARSHGQLAAWPPGDGPAAATQQPDRCPTTHPPISGRCSRPRAQGGRD